MLCNNLKCDVTKAPFAIQDVIKVHVKQNETVLTVFCKNSGAKPGVVVAQMDY